MTIWRYNLFTIMIFLVVTSNFSATDFQADAADDVEDGGGKPNVTDVSGDQEYYVVPVANLHKVTVNGQDRSDAISGSSVAVHANVIDNGQVIIKPGEIIIETPSGVSVNDAVIRPEL